MSALKQVLLVGGLLTLAACGSVPSAPSAPAAQVPAVTPAAGTLEAQASAGTLVVGQTRQLNVTVGGRAPSPGELTWTTSNAAVATVTQTGLVTATGAGNAVIRAALTNYRSSYIDFTLTVTAATAPAPTPAPTTPSGYAGRVLELTNAARAQARTCGATSFAAAPALTYNAQLEQAAQGHATDMATRNYFSHTSLDGRTMAQRISATGYAWRTIGENIAAGQTTPEQVVAGWLASEGHCRNIMNPSFRELGVGYAQGGSYGHYWVQNFGAR
ncbi:uncharacterized protein YkwD [Deinococcus sp. HSC-46F16]|uniref:CAP domain-containing protein n=1 Tax=Deinococcus sp. HSC-46F16 TaxID=2910968 RepID=UPI00209FE4C2|nr:CAP domain-containing protein [Deinococcus sp. HSC-46F16]MCP2013123.1 uncharacterized protein YkwD [Deinococcus sp. HSC-46F16]